MKVGAEAPAALFQGIHYEQSLVLLWWCDT